MRSHNKTSSEHLSRLRVVLRENWFSTRDVIVVLLLLLAIYLLCLSAVGVLVTWSSGRELKDRAYRRWTTLVQEKENSLVLEVSAPQRLQVDDPDQARVPLRVQLRYTPTITSMSPLSPSTHLTYLLHLDPSPDMVLVDEEGNPIGRDFVVMPSLAESKPILVYLHPVLPSCQRRILCFRPPSVTLNVEISRLDEADVLGRISVPMEVESAKESFLRHLSRTVVGASSLLGAVLSAAWAFLRQRWQQAQREEQRSREGARLNEISEVLPELLIRNPSEGARYYIKRRSLWTEAQVQEHLQRIWEEEAEENLQKWVAMWLGEKTPEKITDEDLVKWAYENLDEEWRREIRDWVLEQPQVAPRLYQTIETELWLSVLKPWPSVRLRPVQITEDVIFASTRAEEDACLLDKESIFYPGNWERLRAGECRWILGVEGSGRTAFAFLMVHDEILGIGEGRRFPVYYPLENADQFRSLKDGLESVACALARALLNYTALKPAGFFDQDVPSRTAMAILFSSFLGKQPRRYHLAGFSPQTTQRLLEKMEALVGDDLPSRGEGLEEIGRAFPQGFQGVLLLLDIQGKACICNEEFLKTLTALADRLEEKKIEVKVLLPCEFEEFLGPREPMYLQWEPNDLRELLLNRLRRIGTDTLGEWCKPLGPIDVDGWAVHASGGTPRGLIEKARELQRLYREKGELGMDDLEEVLGPYPKDPRTARG